MTRSSRRTRTRPGEWAGGEPVLVYMVQHLKPSELPDAPWSLIITTQDVEDLWPPPGTSNIVVRSVPVEDNEAWLRDLLREVNEGPTSQRARTGELQGVMRALAKRMTSHRRFLAWKQGNKS